MTPLRAAGLTVTEAKCYQALLSMPDCKPSDLAKIVGESRTNCYKILDKLCDYKLAERVTSGKVIRYRATNPTQLLELARERRLAQEQAEQELGVQVQALFTEYAKIHSQPGVRHFQGKEELKEIYLDQVMTKQPVHFIQTTAGINFYGFKHMSHLRTLPGKADIKRYGIVPDNPYADPNYKETDKLSLLVHRTWMRESDYTAPVEWGVYGDKMYIISFGAEAHGVIIESPQIAEGFLQLFTLLDRGLRRDPNYNELPLLAGQQYPPN